MDPEETEDAPDLIDACPKCGERTLVAECNVVVDYAIENDGEGTQDWNRQEIDDDSSEAYLIRCTSCQTEFWLFELDEERLLVGLTSPISDSEFRAWLTQRVNRFVEENGGDIDDESLDCGDMWREMEDGGELDEIGVIRAWDRDARMMYFSGRDASGEVWVIGSAYELGIEQETVWLNPLYNLQWGEGLVERVRQAAEKLHRQADELGGMVA
ncbi:MAG: hypothetical protein WC072_02785 [Methanoregulaceae archaeon]